MDKTRNDCKILDIELVIAKHLQALGIKEKCVNYAVILLYHDNELAYVLGKGLFSEVGSIVGEKRKTVAQKIRREIDNVLLNNDRKYLQEYFGNWILQTEKIETADFLFSICIQVYKEISEGEDFFKEKQQIILKIRISQILLELGFSARNLAYKYLIDVIAMLYSGKDISRPMSVLKEDAHQTSIIYRAMHYALRMSLKKADEKYLDLYLNISKQDVIKECITVNEFVIAICKYLHMEDDKYLK